MHSGIASATSLILCSLSSWPLPHTQMPTATSIPFRPSIGLAPPMGLKRKRDTECYSEEDSIVMEKPMKKKATLKQEVFGQNMFKSYVKSALDELEKVGGPSFLVILDFY